MKITCENKDEFENYQMKIHDFLQVDQMNVHSVSLWFIDFRKKIIKKTRF